MRRLASRLALVLWLSVVPLAASAQGTPPAPVRELPTSPEFIVTLGLGAGFAPDYEGADEYNPIPLPSLRIDYGQGWLKVNGPGIKVNLSPLPWLEGGFSLGYVGGRDDVDDDVVDRLEEIDGGAEFGLFLGLSHDLGPVAASVEVGGRTEFAGGHDGYLIDLSAGLSRAFSPQLLGGLSVSSTWTDTRYINEYFGVTPRGSLLSGLPGYSADAGFKDLGLGATLTWRFAERWAATGLLNHTWLLDDAADSPIVDQRGSSSQLFGGLIVSYRFSAGQ